MRVIALILALLQLRQLLADRHFVPLLGRLYLREYDAFSLLELCFFIFSLIMNLIGHRHTFALQHER